MISKLLFTEFVQGYKFSIKRVNEKHPEDAFKGKNHLDISRQAVESTMQAGY